MSLEVINFGCRLNAEESARMKNLAAGLHNTIIINSCAVTAEAERQARQFIKRTARDFPQKKIIVTGCASERQTERWAALPGVTAVVPNTRKTEEGAWRDLGAQPQSYAPQPEAGRARALLAVQNGCDHRCTFCIIPYGRGASRSLPVDAAVREARAFVKEGFQEIVLTGVDLTSYGQDLPSAPRLGTLVKTLLREIPELPRLRLSSIDPAEIDPDLWQALAIEERLMPYWHLSVQAGDDVILKRMKRRHTRQQVAEVCSRARSLRPEITIGADLIAGFPTESDAMFQNTADLIDAAGLTWLHVFPYSARTGTPAARMPQIPGPVRAARAEILRKLGERAVARHLPRHHQHHRPALIEGKAQGRLPDFTPVRLPQDHGLRLGNIYQLPIRLDADGALVAEIPHDCAA